MNVVIVHSDPCCLLYHRHEWHQTSFWVTIRKTILSDLLLSDLMEKNREIEVDKQQQKYVLWEGKVYSYRQMAHVQTSTSQNVVIGPTHGHLLAACSQSSFPSLEQYLQVLL